MNREAAYAEPCDRQRRPALDLDVVEAEALAGAFLMADLLDDLALVPLELIRDRRLRLVAAVTTRARRRGERWTRVGVDLGSLMRELIRHGVEETAAAVLVSEIAELDVDRALGERRILELARRGRS